MELRHFSKELCKRFVEDTLHPRGREHPAWASQQLKGVVGDRQQDGHDGAE